MSKQNTSAWIPWLAAMVPIGLSACNQYEMFLVTGSEQVAFTGKVDVLFVVDNSASVSEEASALMKNFDNFIETLAGDDAYGQNTENLTDSVNDYITFTSNRASAIDYRLAVITTNLLESNWSSATDPGEAGLFVGNDPVISRGDEGEKHRFLQHVGCWSTCWGDLPTDGTYTGTSGDCPFPDNDEGEATSQYLECLCVDVVYPDASANYESNNLCDPGGIEKPIEATLLAMCRATENPPEVCWHDGSALEAPATEGAPADQTDWYMTNPGWLRDDAKLVVIVISDEGDSSNHNLTPAGLFDGSSDEDPTPYIHAFEDFDRDITFAVIGPDFRCEDDGSNCVEYCNSGDANSPGAKRLMNLAKITGGFYRPITKGDEPGRVECEVADFSVHLDELGKLMMNLQTAFQLRAVPEEDSIRVYIDDEIVSRAGLAEITTGDDTLTFGDSYNDGWSYDPGQNAILFWGSAVPDFNQDVEIFYRPLDGNPRELPI
jgi:hypothetical protein